MIFGKRFKAYMNNYPNAAIPSANRCSKLPYNELRAMAKNMYNANDAAKDALYHYQNMPKDRLVGSVYYALGTLNK